MSLMDSMDDSNELVFRRASAPPSSADCLSNTRGGNILNLPVDHERGPGHITTADQDRPADSSARCKSFQFVPESVPRHHSYAESPGGYARLAQVSRPKFWLEVVQVDGHVLQRVPMRHKSTTQGVMLTSAAGGGAAMVRFDSSDHVRVLLFSERPSSPALPFLELSEADLGRPQTQQQAQQQSIMSDMLDDQVMDYDGLDARAHAVADEDEDDDDDDEKENQDAGIGMGSPRRRRKEQLGFRLLQGATFSEDFSSGEAIMNVSHLSAVIPDSMLPRSLHSPINSNTSM